MDVDVVAPCGASKRKSKAEQQAGKVVERDVGDITAGNSMEQPMRVHRVHGTAIRRPLDN